jgi:TonB family protein
VEAEDSGAASDVAELAARFSASSGAGLSRELASDLALEIVFNEIVEQACLATGATGAAIALKRDEEMICRATSGSTAPDLGSPLDTSAGLSGECIRTLRTQRCDDVLTDPRADVAASLRLGVRSVMVMPLFRGEELLGVFELFSSRACAFGDRDERTLEALASRTLASLERAAQPPVETHPVLERAGALGSGVEGSESDTQVQAEGDQDAATNTGILAAGEGRAGRNGLDVITSVLAVAVLACAVLLGVLLGRHLGAPNKKTRLHPASRSAVSAAAPAVGAAGSATSRKVSEAGPPPPPAVSSKPRVNSAVPPGGLLVFENGKEVFRMAPTPGESGAAAADHAIGMQRAASLEPEKKQQTVLELPPAEVDSSLLHRVDPKYPDEARQHQIQGAVVLEVHINPDGAVEAVHLVSGPPQLMQAATDAVKQWRFKPRTENGEEVRMHTLVTLNFQLPQ